MRDLATSEKKKYTALRQCRYFSSLSDELLIPLAAATRLIRYQAGEIIFLEGERCQGLYIIHRGEVKLFKTSPQGRELVVNTFEAGESFNEVPIFDQSGNPVNAAALTKCDLWVVNADSIRQTLDEHPEMATAIILNLAQNLRMLVQRIAELSFFQVTTRLARLLNDLPPEQLCGKASERLTQDDLATRIGSVREVVARALRKLETSGAIQVSRAGIIITDPHLLRKWAQMPKDGSS